MSAARRPRSIAVAALVAAVFGLLSILSAGMVLFGPDAARASAGAYAGFVVWFNFCSGFVYVLAALALWAMRREGVWLALGLVGAIALVSAGFGWHITAGGAYEMRTVAALLFRFAVWLAIAFVAWSAIARTR
ncbi:MAG: hypothetical protein JNM90_17035 [Burkholderiales bacterium]|nr:hypothetical protein [Burkholderiales bacterium]